MERPRFLTCFLGPLLFSLEDSVSEIRTCWAISAALKARCDMPAGHTGDHSITVSWGDEQCWSPETDEPVALRVVEPDMMSGPVDNYVQEPVQEKPEACVACNHMHKSGECKCGCYNHV